MEFGLKDHSRYVLDRARAALQSLGARALIATLPVNVHYLTGYDTYTAPAGITKQAIAVLTPASKRILIVPAADSDFVVMGGHFADEVVYYGTFFIEDPRPGVELSAEEQAMAACLPGMLNTRTWLQALTSVLAAEGLNKGMIALDPGNLMPSYFQALTEALPEARLVDAFRPLLLARSVKDSYEIAASTASAVLTEKAYLAAFAVCREGTSDYEVQAAFKKALIDGGAEHRFSAIGVGPRTAYPNVQPNGALLERGGLVRIDGGGRLNGYPSDLARNATLGPAPARIRQIYQAMLNAEEEAINAVKPGATGQEVFDIAVAAARKSGVPGYRRHHCGHAHGLENYETPLIKPGETMPFVPGMVFCIETPYYELGLGGLQVEDLVLVTETGHKILNSLSRELIELPG